MFSDPRDERVKAAAAQRRIQLAAKNGNQINPIFFQEYGDLIGDGMTDEEYKTLRQQQYQVWRQQTESQRASIAANARAGTPDKLFGLISEQFQHLFNPQDIHFLTVHRIHEIAEIMGPEHFVHSSNRDRIYDILKPIYDIFTAHLHRSRPMAFHMDERHLVPIIAEYSNLHDYMKAHGFSQASVRRFIALERENPEPTFSSNFTVTEQERDDFLRRVDPIQLGFIRPNIIHYDQMREARRRLCEAVVQRLDPLPPDLQRRIMTSSLGRSHFDDN
jgi:hypothetical protein